jgi:hypothetical protein
VRSDEGDRTAADLHGAGMKREGSAEAERKRQNRTDDIGADVFERCRLAPGTPDVARDGIEPNGGSVGIAESIAIG